MGEVRLSSGGDGQISNLRFHKKNWNDEMAKENGRQNSQLLAQTN